MATQDRLPTGVGADNSWASGTAGNKWDDVDDPIGTPDEDTTYIVETTSYQSQTFTFTAFSITSSAIDKVSITNRLKCVGTVSYQNRLRVNGTSYNSSTAATTTSYVDYTTDWLTNPNTAAAWVEADVEGVGANPLQQFGVIVSTIDASEELRCTQSYITVTYTEAGGGGVTYPQLERGIRGVERGVYSGGL